jgi:hypothetical protein
LEAFPKEICRKNAGPDELPQVMSQEVCKKDRH